MRNTIIWTQLLALVVLFFCLGAAGGEEPATGSDKQQLAANAQLSEAEINSEIDALLTKIKSLQDAESEATATSLGVTLPQLKERTEKAQETLSFYNRLLLALKMTKALEDDRKNLEAAVATGEAYKVAQLPPYSLKVYDEAIGQLDESLNSKETAQLSLDLAAKVLKNGRQRLKEAEQQLREVKAEVAEAPKQAGSQAVLQWKQAGRQADVALARAALRFAEQDHKNGEAKLAVADIRLAIAQQKLKHIRANLHFDSEDLAGQLASIDDKRAELDRQSEDLFKRLQRSEALLVKAQKKLEKTSGEEDLARMRAEVAALELWRQACQRGLEQYESTVQLLGFQKEIWKQRYDLVGGEVDSQTIKTWQKAVLSQQDRIEQTLALEQSQQVALQVQISQVEKQLAQNDLGWDMKGSLKDQLEALEKMAAANFNYMTTLSVTNQMASRFIDEMAAELSENVVAEKIGAMVSKVKAAWNFELMVVDDQSVTAGKIAIALFLLIFGIILSGYLTRAVQRHILARTRLSESAAAITEKLLYYLIITLVVLGSMRVVNIPLTAFAFLGGALAIGVGFGGQKIISNFISGFILMAEQPVKVGDLIQMADIVGKIEEIGARSTRVRTFANIHVLVPNSYFLENNIINWTHSDKIIRGEVTVGVIYGSPTKEVRRLLMLAVRDHKETLDYPKPYVFFNDFGDNALIFTIYFWITVQLINDKKRIESDVRFIIDDMFREAGIVIAFPQRDVHLDTSQPLRLEMVNPAAEELQPGKGGEGEG